MLSARWRRRPFCLQRNTTSGGNPKEKEGGRDGKFLSRRNTEGKSVPRLARKAEREEGGRDSSRAGRPCEIIFSADQGTFIQYPRQHLASNGSAAKCLYGVSENVPGAGHVAW